MSGQAHANIGHVGVNSTINTSVILILKEKAEEKKGRGGQITGGKNQKLRKRVKTGPFTSFNLHFLLHHIFSSSLSFSYFSLLFVFLLYFPLLFHKYALARSHHPIQANYKKLSS